MQIVKKLWIVIFISMLESCSAQTDRVEDCEENYAKGRDFINKYAESYNKEYLYTALSLFDSSFLCKSTRFQSINSKIITYNLLRNYKEGSEYINSLQSEEFKKPYEKKINKELFDGYFLQSSGDSIGARTIFMQIASDLKTFLINKKSGDLEKDVLSTLIFIESKYFSVSQLKDELEELKGKFPNDKEFIDSLEKVITPIEDF